MQLLWPTAEYVPTAHVPLMVVLPEQYDPAGQFTQRQVGEYWPGEHELGQHDDPLCIYPALQAQGQLLELPPYPV